MPQHNISTAGHTQLEIRAVYFTALIIIIGLYSLPHLLPRAIGTGYIVLYSALMGLSLMLWRRETLHPRRILGLGFIVLIALYPLAMLTSNDAERYLWDGAVFLSGFDPYLTAPDSAAVAELRSYWPTPEEHAAYPTLYPPGALALFGFSALAGPIYGVWVWKAIATLAAMLSLYFIYDLLRRRDALRALPLAVLSPLLLLETSAGYHLDIFCVLGVSAALYFIDRERIIWAGIIIGLAATIKFLPAVIAGPLLFYFKPSKALKLFLAASLTWGAAYLLMFGIGYKPLGLLPTFFEKWRGGAPLYPVLENLQTATGLGHKGFLTLLALLAISGFGLSAFLARKGHIMAAIMLSLAVPLLLSPVLFPWYLMIFVPLLALRPNLTLIIAFTLAPLSYVVLNKWLSQGVWEPAAWPAALLLIGIAAGLFYDIIFKRKRFDQSA